jgi:hypothetical protein
VPPRFAYWTILIDNAPTAFRARDAQELLPTLNQLKRTNPNVVMKWFARGKLWESMEQEHADFAQIKARERRTKDWRPGGDHKDPRARFDKEKRRRDKREERAERNARPQSPIPGPQPPRGPWKPRPDQPARDSRPSSDSPRSADRSRHDRPWKPKPKGDRPWKPKSHRPWSDHAPRRDGDRPWQRKPEQSAGGRGQSTGGGHPDRPWKPKPKGDRPWSDRPPRRDGDRPWQDKKRASSGWQSSGGGRQDRPGQDRPWKPKPSGARPWQNKNRAPGTRTQHQAPGTRHPRKKRDDED